MARVAALWRHPIKSHGREALESVALAAGQPFPWDRRWAVVHDAAADDASQGWVPCQNFMIGTRTPGLAGIWARLDAEAGRITLSHADLGEIAFSPDDAADQARFLDWVMPLCPDTRARPAAVVALPDRAWTDTDYPSVTLMNAASHRAVEERIGRPLEPERWRGNIWFDGQDAFEELDWIGKRLRVGTAILEVREPVKRCLHTAANPQTGARDADTLGALDAGWGHRNFGIYTEVVQDGDIALGDELEILK
ncbi:MAG TPA: MOSC domain-containing protein [Paracoccaceae bacterium]|nr:MOSC domain-containing protein [Paracoccaceae bacterium]